MSQSSESAYSNSTSSTSQSSRRRPSRSTISHVGTTKSTNTSPQQQSLHVTGSSVLRNNNNNHHHEQHQQRRRTTTMIHASQKQPISQQQRHSMPFGRLLDRPSFSQVVSSSTTTNTTKPEVITIDDHDESSYHHQQVYDSNTTTATTTTAPTSSKSKITWNQHRRTKHTNTNVTSTWSHNDTSSSSTKRMIHDNNHNNNNNNNNTNNNNVWTIQYQPQSSKQLVVAMKKVNEVRDWMQQHIQYNTFVYEQQQQRYNNNDDGNIVTKSLTPPPPHPIQPSSLLILVGNPGIGKSTMIQCLAKELGYTIVEWTESLSMGSSSVISSFEYFLQQCNSTIQPLQFQSSEYDHHHTSLSTTTTITKTGTTCRNDHNKLILIDELPYTHTIEAQQQLQLIFTNHIVRHHHHHYDESSSSSHSFGKTNITTTSIPTIWIYSHAPEGKVQYSDLERYIHPNILYHNNHNSNSAHNTVMNSNNNKNNMESSSSLSITTVPYCTIISIQSPTKTKFRSAIQDIVSQYYQQQQQYHKINSSKYQYYTTTSYIDELYTRCIGDVRFAIHTLQYEMIGDLYHDDDDDRTIQHAKTTTTKKQKKHNNNISISSSMISNHIQQQKDTKLSAFHALGKLLYAKRQNNHSNNIKNTSIKLQDVPLEFDPDMVIQQSDMELQSIIPFLSYHCIDFYTDMNDISNALSYFSDTSYLCDYISSSVYESYSSSIMNDIGSCMVGRVVAYTNHHPAPSSFRPLNAPKVYDVLRKRRTNQERIRYYCRNQWINMRDYDHHLSTTTTSTTTMESTNRNQYVNDHTFAMDILPYLRMIVSPQHSINTSVFLDSYFDQSNILPANGHTAIIDPFIVSQQQERDIKLWKEQEEILKHDDIVEDFDDF